MDMDTIFAIIATIVLLGVAGGCAFAALKVKKACNELDTKVGSELDGIKAKTEALKPAVAEMGPLMEKVNIAMDALDVELVKIDGKLDELSAMTGTVSGVVEATPQVIEEVKSTLRTAIRG